MARGRSESCPCPPPIEIVSPGSRWLVGPNGPGAETVENGSYRRFSLEVSHVDHFQIPSVTIKYGVAISDTATMQTKVPEIGYRYLGYTLRNCCLAAHRSPMADGNHAGGRRHAGHTPYALRLYLEISGQQFKQHRSKLVKEAAACLLARILQQARDCTCTAPVVDLQLYSCTR